MISRLLAVCNLLGAALLLLPACHPSETRADDAPSSSTVSFRPTGSLALERGPEVGGGKVAEGSILQEDSQIYFLVETTGADYLYLLQHSNAGVEVLHPPTGQVFLSTAGQQRIVPHPPNMDAEEQPLTGYSTTGTGVFEYLLLASPVPRDFPSNSQVSTVERMVQPPPYLSGPMAQPAVILDKIRVTWGSDDL